MDHLQGATPFRDAQLAAPGIWFVDGRLRGQAGTDGLMPDVWPVGSRVVLIDAAVEQIALALGSRRLARHYRIGPARRPLGDPSYTHRIEAFDGNGLRPYRPCHLRFGNDGGDHRFDWIRRSRIAADDWEPPEVPLGEETEAYAVRVLVGGQIVRSATVTSPTWAYPAAERAADGAGAGYEFEVAQVSAIYGPGPYARLAGPS